MLGPKSIDQPATLELDRRAALFSVATRIATLAGVIAIAALLFVIMKPPFRQSLTSPTPLETTGSIPQSNQGNVDAKAALAELNAPVTSPPSQSATREQSQELLQRFLQWREKANTAEASQP
jgi:hypothetical protein